VADVAARIAAAVGDPAALLVLAIELAQANAQLEQFRTDVAERDAADAARRAADAQRKREARGSSRPRMSTDVHGHARMSEDGGGPPPPAPPLDPPAPPINPSSPPSPASSSSAGRSPDEIEAENRLLDRTATARHGASRAVLLRFLGHWEGVGRVSWVGRLSALMDDAPNFTDEELVEGLEALMTEPRASWKPSVLKAWVRRVRSDAEREKARPLRAGEGRGESTAGGGADVPNAGAVFAHIRQLVQTTDPVPGQPRRRFIRRTDVEALGARVVRAYDEIGGADRFTDPDEKVGFVLRDFTKALGTLNGVHP
jgi:hypothetical protein